MTSTDSNEPTPEEFDAALAGALNEHRNTETTRDTALLVATYYRTLTEEGVPDESATELTCLWFAHAIGGDE